MKRRGVLIASAALVCLTGGVAFAVSAWAAPLEPVHSVAAKEKASLLDTLKELVSIESGSSDREGLDRIAAVIVGRLRALGGQVEMIDANPADTCFSQIMGVRPTTTRDASSFSEGW